MDLSLVFNGVSAWWVIICIFLGTGYAWLLYRKDHLLGKPLRRLLFGFRAFVVALLAFLLLSPVIKSISRTIEKPLVIIAQDNSSSILFDEKNREWYRNELPEALHALQNELQDNYQVRAYHFSDHPENGLSADFNGKQTDMSLLMQEIKTRFSGRNLGAVILLSDGIYNKGSNPLYAMQGVNAPFYTVALGDTIPKKDLLISSVEHNQVVFLGNDFRINVNAEAFGLKGSGSRITVRHKGQTVFSDEIVLDETDYRVSIPIDLTANEKGRQKYDISLQPLPGEITSKNNTRTIFTEVLDSRRKILVLAAAPHPDLGALKHALESDEQYELDIRFASEAGAPDLKAYSLAIFHQLPSQNHKLPAVLQAVRQEKLPAWFIIGNQTDIEALNRYGQSFRFSRFQGSYNEAFAVPDPSFYLFTIPEEIKKQLAAMPPLTAPFCEITALGPASILFTQRINSVATKLPLMAFSTMQESRSAWLFGEGLWRWRLHDFRLNGNHQAVNELLTKTVQYLAASEDTRRFRLSMPKDVFSENEAVTFTAELYNESYEPVTEPDIRILIKDQQNKTFPFTFSRSGDSYHLNAGILPVGEYTYTASVKLGEKESTASGSFAVAALNAEELQTTANHQLLFTMAENSGGEMLYPRETGKLPGLLSAKEEISPVAYEQERYKELIDLKWIFFLALILLGTEWFLRKRNGLY